MRKILFVIDMQNDFVAEGGALSFPGAREIVPFISNKVKKALERGQEVLFSLDSHTPDDAEFERFAPHCIIGTSGHELIPELKRIIRSYKDTGQVKFVKKNRYSAFYNTDLDTWLASGKDQGKVTEVEMVGVCTNICCFFTAEELANRDIPTKVFVQGVASFDHEGHKAALGQMQSVLGVEIVE